MARYNPFGQQPKSIHLELFHEWMKWPPGRRDAVVDAVKLMVDMRYNKPPASTKASRAYKRFKRALEYRDPIWCSQEAVRLGVDPDHINGILVLLGK